MLQCIFSISHTFLIAMSKKLISKNHDKNLPSMYKSKHNSCAMSLYGKYELLRNKNCKCYDLTQAKSNSNSIVGNDRAIACAFNCNKCNKTIY